MFYEDGPVTEPGRLETERLRHAADCAVVGVSASRSRQVAPVGSAKRDTVFRIASLTKPLTAASVVLASRRTGTGLDTRVLDILPELSTDWVADKALTIADVLSQTSGLASTVTVDEVLRLGDHDSVLVEASRLVVRAGNARPRGRTWEYYNGNYFVAGAVLAALTGTTYEDALAEMILRPWGLADTSFIPPADLAPGVDQGSVVPAVGYPRGGRPSGGLCSTADDLQTFGEHLLEDRSLLAEIQSVRTRPDDSMRYGLGWAIGPSGQMYLNGRLPGYRAALMLVPRNDLVAVVLAANSAALPAVAHLISDLQYDLTGDDLSEAIDAFAA